MKKKEEAVKEWFVQTIPYGEQLISDVIKVNNFGQVVIETGSRIMHIEDLDAAIRQQSHILLRYQNIEIHWPWRYQIQIQIRHKELEKEKADIIIKKTFERLRLLLNERERCKKIIKETVIQIIKMIHNLTNEEIRGIEGVEWKNYFDQIKALRTIYVNPYRTTTQSPLYNKLKYDVYKLCQKNDNDVAIKLLWQGLEKLLKFYPGRLTITVGENKIRVKDGIILL